MDRELQGSRILVVDDNPTNVIILFDYFSKFDFTVLVAEKGEDALELVEENMPDIILMDIIMPGISGFETCRKLKAGDKTKDIPVLFVSSLSDTLDKVRGFEAGGVDYITKPFQQEEVLARVTTHLHLHKLKKELEKKNVALEKEINERKRAEGAAEAASRAKSEFLANMSHELRTPLNGILGYAQILKREKILTESQKKGLDIIERSGNHLLNLINGILDLSKIEAQKMELSETAFQFTGLLNAITAMIRIQAEKKGISFNFDFHPDLPAGVRADEKRLSQILLNLLSNAVKFTDHGSVLFRVSKIQNSKSETRFRFQVEDTGIGIPANQLNDIFSAFKQVGEHARSIEGTGLGLAISQQLTRLMGSELYVKSTAGKGSSFWFDLDLPEVSEWTETEMSKEQHAIGFKGEKQKILVIDDKWENRTVLSSFLLPLGFEVIEATNGRDGLNKALKHKPDLILMDLIMPVMDGFEATRQIRKSSELRHIKVIAVSASTLIPPEKILSETGCDDYMSKPLKMNEVLSKLSRFLELEWIYEENAESATTDSDDAAKNEKGFAVPPSSEIRMLCDLALDGNFKELQKQLDEIGRADQRYAGFTVKVRSLAKMLDEDSICEFLDQYIEDEEK